jgi:hypothetical protein
MRSIFLKCLIGLSFLIASGTTGFAESLEISSSASFRIKPANTVVELFTSQGCSSCPPADVLLEKYVKAPNVVALSYSVDYWDYLGWRDTYGKKANSERQRNYARARGDGSVYTPQAVVNGLEHMNGASQYKINTKIKETKKRLNSKLINFKVSEIEGGKVRIWSEDTVSTQGVVLWMVWVKDKANVAIRRGENRGRTIAYHNIVLGVEKVADFSKDGVDLTVARDKIVPKDGKHCIFLAQVGASGPVLGALEIK